MAFLCPVDGKRMRIGNIRRSLDQMQGISAGVTFLFLVLYLNIIDGKESFARTQHPFVRQSVCVQIASERSLDCYKNCYSIRLGKSSGTGVRLM
jgi:hypothetical protein